MKEKGFAHILLIFLCISALALVFVLVFNKSYLTKFTPGNFTGDKSSTSELSVSLKSDYQNPFDKDSQYTNPFSTYKNPFDQLK